MRVVVEIGPVRFCLPTFLTISGDVGVEAGKPVRWLATSPNDSRTTIERFLYMMCSGEGESGEGNLTTFAGLSKA